MKRNSVRIDQKLKNINIMAAGRAAIVSIEFEYNTLC